MPRRRPSASSYFQPEIFLLSFIEDLAAFHKSRAYFADVPGARARYLFDARYLQN